MSTTQRRSRFATMVMLLIAAIFGSLVVEFRSVGSVEPSSSTARFDISDYRLPARDLGKDDDKYECNKGDYRKSTLQLAYEMPMVALFKDMKGQRKHEASDVIKVGDTIYTVCDSSWSIAKFPDTLQPFSTGNVLIGAPTREEDESGYEAIVHEGDLFYVIRESIHMGEDDGYHAIIEELSIEDDGDDTGYEIKDQCPCEMEFEGDSKGFEGAIAVRDLNFHVIIIALCEGNYCSEKRKSEKGNGRLVAMQKVIDEEHGTCEWKTIRTIKIPESADFTDYSAITMDESGRVAISSQEDSKMWVGQLAGKTGNVWDIAAMEFDADESKVYDFPKNDQCKTVYCNIEGIHWVNEHMIVAVSDRMKKKQDFRCFSKDQSVHTFVLPFEK